MSPVHVRRKTANRPRGRRTTSTATAIAVLAAGLGAAVATAPAATAATHEATFDQPGAHTFVVPDGVTGISVRLTGGSGASSWETHGGAGAVVRADLPVTPGSTVHVHVGGHATGSAGGVNGGGPSGRGLGGGGGASDVRIGSDTLDSRVLVAAGGGGAGWSGGGPAPAHGGDAGQPGGDGIADFCGGSTAAQPGGQEAGGAGGVGCAGYGNGAPGAFGVGGAGADDAGSNTAGGGGGGGWYGGGGGNPYAGGAGGSNHVAESATAVETGLAAYGTAPSVTISYTLTDQAITFTSTAPAPGLVGETYQVTATGGGSTSPVTLAAAPESDEVCSVADAGGGSATVTFTGEGSCVVRADQAGGSGFEPAPQAEQTVQVERRSQVLTFPRLGTMEVGAPGQQLRATASSELEVRYRSETREVCVVRNVKVRALSPGRCRITARQVGDATYEAAVPLTRSLKVRRG